MSDRWAHDSELLTEVLGLTHALLADEATGDEQQRHHDLVSTDPIARQYYLDAICDQLNLRAILKERQTQPVDDRQLLRPASVIDRFQSAIHWDRHRVRFGLFVFTVTLMLWAILLSPWEHDEATPAGRRTDIVAVERVADISRTRGTVWTDASSALWKGLSLTAGTLVDLKSGLIEISFRDGATAIVEGPARFRVTGSNSGELSTGKLTARVPKRAVGFTVETTAARLVDLGTEFGALVDDQKSTLIHVYQGSVEVSLRSDQRSVSGTGNSGAGKRTLVAGQTLKIDVSGTWNEIDARNVKFVRSKSFDQNLAYTRWLEYSEQLRTDPDMVAYYSFQQSGETAGRLVNQAAATRGRFDCVLGNSKKDDATLPIWSSGRWKGKRALSFRADQRQSIVIRDWKNTRIDHEMTLAAWIRMRRNSGYQMIVSQWNGPTVFYIALRERDNRYQGRGLPVAMRLAEDDIGDGVRKSEVADGTLSNTRDGWFHVAFTVKAGGAVRLYKNGKEIDAALKTYAPDKLLTADTRLIVGGYGDAYFDGWIDELLLMRRAVSQQEILNMVEIGTPQSKNNVYERSR